MPKRIQLRRTKGWRKPDGAIVVSRPSKWGNPFHGPDAVEAFREWMRIVVLEEERGPFLIREFDVTIGKRTFDVQFVNMPTWDEIADLRASIDELRGKDLCCWCPLYAPCHADVLLELANRKQD